MTVIKEFVAKLGFEVDNRNLEKFEGSIIGFKTKFGLAAGAAAIFTSKMLQFFSEAAKVSMEAENIAQASGVALKDFVSLQQALTNFNVRPDAFNSAFATLSKSIREAKNGFGSLITLMDQRPDLNLKNADGSFKNTIEVFYEIIDSLGRITNEEERARVAINLFGQQIGQDLARSATQGSEALRKLAEENERVGQGFADRAEELREYDKSLLKLDQTWNNLKVTVGEFAIPAATGAVGLIDKILNVGFVETYGKNLVGDLDIYGSDFEGGMSADSLISQKVAPMSSQSAAPIQNNVTLNNSTSINVPPGTTEEQALYIESRVTDTFNILLDRQIRDLSTNSPTRE